MAAHLVLAPVLPDAPYPPTTQQTRSPTVLPSSPCDCQLNNGNPCYTYFSIEDVSNFQENYLELSQTNDLLDVSILAKLQCGMHTGDYTTSTKKGAQNIRQRNRIDYYHLGLKICKDFFMYLHCLKKDKLENLISHLKKNDVSPRYHGNKARAPKHAMKFAEIRRVIDFITNYAEQHAITLPGRHLKHWITDARLLPTSCTKRHVYNLYKNAAQENGYRDVCESLFLSLWKQLVPFIRTTPPASDLCWQCQETTRKMLRTANRPDAEKEACVHTLETHLKVVASERKYYQDIVKNVREQPGIAEGEAGRHQHCTFGMNHVSFDFAQQTHFPSSPQQPGSIYIYKPRKCGLFGVDAEAKGIQVNYLIDEAHACGKGGNPVISYLHDFLENHSLGERELYKHADNTSGQNKNNYMMWYLLWRCLTGRNTQVRLSFLIAGHTKFSPEGGFGLFKRKLKREDVNYISGIERATNSTADMNTVDLAFNELGLNETSHPRYF